MAASWSCTLSNTTRGNLGLIGRFRCFSREEIVVAILARLLAVVTEMKGVSGKLAAVEVFRA